MAKWTPPSERPGMGRSRGFGGPGADHDGVEVREQFLRGNILAGLGLADELDALRLHLADAAHDDFFLVQLHVRDAVHEQPAGPVGALEDGHQVARPVELRRGAQPGGAGADDRDALAGTGGRRLGDDPAFLPAAVGDRATRCS